MTDFKSSIIEFIQSQPWAIYPDYLDKINNILYLRYFGNGQRLEPEGFEVKMRGPYMAAGEPSESATKQNVMVIPAVGVIAKRMNLFHDISGGVSTQKLQSQIKDALNNPEVNAIVLDIDSPGGVVDGIKVLSDFIYESRGTKPILAHANGQMTSGAIYIGAATDRITAYGPTMIGSIGVVMKHYDYSKYYENAGLKVTNLYKGDYKIAGTDIKPLEGKEKDYLQGIIDDTYTMFVNDVARYRDMPAKDIIDTQAKVYLADEALKLGLIDEIATLEQTIQMAADKAAGDTQEKREVKKTMIIDAVNADSFVKSLNKHKEEINMSDLEKIQKEMKALTDRVTTLEESNTQLVEQNKSLEAANIKKDEQIAALEATNKELDKDLTIMKTKQQSESERALADSITDKVLADSNIPEDLHEKVRGQVDYKKFKSDKGDFTEDSEAAKAFTAAFTTEVEDWEKRLKTNNALGAGGGKHDDTTASARYASENADLVKDAYK